MKTEPIEPTDRREFLQLWREELSPEFLNMLQDTTPNKLPFLVEHIAWKAWRKGRGK